MESFKDKSFSVRFEYLGDTSESVFRKWAESKEISYEEYGLRRPPFDYFKFLPLELRHTPDFLCEQKGKKPYFRQLRDYRGRFCRHFFVEVKAIGHDQIIKIKQNEFKALQHWERFAKRPVVMFVYDISHQRVTTIPLRLLDEVTATAEVHYFHDGGPPKPYWALAAEQFTWEAIEPMTMQE